MATASGNQGKQGNDVNFVVGLSENLLLECRRLSAENSQYKLRLQDSQDDLERVTRQLTNVQAINKKFLDEEDSIKDKNWELQGSMQLLQEKYEKLYSENVKLSLLKLEFEKVQDQLVNDIELQKLANIKLNDELSTTKQQLTSESKNYKSVNEDLNNENDELHKAVSELNEELEKLKSTTKRMSSKIPVINDPSFFNPEASDSDNEFSVIENPSSSPIKDAPARNLELEKETMQSNLIHSNKTITKLRSTVMKLRSEKLELEARLSSQKNQPLFSSPATKGKKFNLKSPPSISSNRLAKTLSFYEDDESAANWEDFSIGNSPIKQSAPKSVPSSDEEFIKSLPDSRKTLSLELETDSLTLVNKYILDNNLVLVDVNEYNQLKELDAKTKPVSLQDSAIVAAAEKYNILALPTIDAHAQKDIPVDLLKEKCVAKGLVPLNKDDYEELVLIAKHEPTEAELIDKISKYNRTVLPLDEHQKLVDMAENPSLDHLKTQLSGRYDQVCLTSSDYEKLLNPTLDEIRALPSLNESILISKNDYSSMQKQIEDPSFEYLQEKITENYNYIPILQNDYEKFTNPSLESVRSFAGLFNYTVVPAEEYDSLVNLKVKPSLEYLQSRLMEDYEYVAVPGEKYEEFTKPSLDSIKASAVLANHVVIPVESHEKLLQMTTKPTRDQMNSIAGDSNVVISKAEHLELQQKATNPSSDQLYLFATAADLVLLNREEHDKLASNTKAPTLQFLTSKLEALDHVIVPQTSYTELELIANESLSNRAAKENSVVMLKSDHEALINKYEETQKHYSEPTQEYLNEKAAALGYDLIDSETHKKLQESFETPLSEKAAQVDQTLVDNNSYLHLLSVAENPSEDFLVEKAALVGLKVLEAKELEALENLKLLIESPSLEFLESAATKLGHSVVTTDEAKILKSVQTTEGLHTFASEKGLSLIGTSDLEAIKSKATQEGEAIKELSSTVENPSQEFLISKAALLGMSLLPTKEIDELKTLNAETLEAKAEREKKTVLSNVEYSKLKSDMDSPLLEYLEKKAADLSYKLVPKQDFDELNRKALNPTQAELSEHANAFGSALVEKKTLENMQENISNPNIEFIQIHASKLGHSLIPESEYTDLLALKNEPLSEKALREDSVILPVSNYKRLSKLEEAPSIEFLKSKAESLDHEILHAETIKDLKEQVDEPLASKANKAGMVLLSNEEYLQLNSKVEGLEQEALELKEKELHPDPSFIIKLADNLGMVVLKPEDYTLLSQAASSPSLEQLKASAAKKDQVLIPKWKYEILERKATSPTEDELSSIASNIGMKLIALDEFKRLSLESTSPSRETLNKAATELGLVLVSNKEYELLQNTFANSPVLSKPMVFPQEEFSAPSSPVSPTIGGFPSKSKVLNSKERYEELIKKENERKIERQKDQASKALGIVSLSTEEYKRLLAKQQDYEPTISDVYNHAKNFGLTVMQQSDYKLLLKRHPVDTPQDLRTAAKLLGFSIVPLNFARNLSAISLTDDDDDFHDAVSHQSSKMSLVSSEVFEDALSRQNTETSDIHAVKESRSSEEPAIPVEEPASEVDAYETDDDVTSIEENTKDEELVGDITVAEPISDVPTVPALDFEKLEKDFKNLEAQFDEVNNRKLSEEDLRLLAESLGLVIITQSEYEELNKSLTEDEMKSHIEARGFVVVDREEYERSTLEPDESRLKEAVSLLGFSMIAASELESLKESATKIPSNEEIEQILSHKGMVSLPESEYQSLKSEMDDNDLVALAKSRGYEPLKIEEFNTLNSLVTTAPLSLENVKTFLESEGLVTLTKQEHEELLEFQEKLSERPSGDKLEEIASSMGLMVISTEDHDRLENYKVTEMDVVENAPNYGLILISQSEFSKLQQQPSMTENDLAAKAATFGLTLISPEELAALKDRTITADELASKAAELDLILVSQESYRALKSTSVIERSVEQSAKDLGLLCIPESLYVPTTVAPTLDVSSVVVLPKTYYNKLARSHTLSVERISKEELIDFCKKRGIALAESPSSRHESFARNEQVPASSFSTPQPQTYSPVQGGFKSPMTPAQKSSGSQIVASPSLFSIATNVSLTDQKMIPALTQTIIGEYLYKYYRRLGPFSSMSENRHERYFWIHPYSLTLYWSTTNPVLGDTSTNKIRAAAILRVEAVDDNNPLPPGLYHKSIIVHSSDKSVKITCPTRQRHNVWYNSLRYLIERTTDNLDLSASLDHLPGSQSENFPSTIREEEDEGNDIDTYRYIKPRASMVTSQRSVSNPTRKSSRIFSPHSTVHRSSTMNTFPRKTS